MKILRHTDRQFTQEVKELTASSSLFNLEIEQRTREIVEGVRLRGDEALAEFTQKFDGHALTAERFAITKSELLAASLQAAPPLRKALELARKNIENFARRSLRKNWTARNAQGAVVGEKFDPYDRVGIYIPGGTAPLVSTTLMTIVLAKVAGNAEIIVCTPSGRDGAVNSGLLFSANIAGASAIYRIGGAQAIAAMAFGTPTIPRVQKIFGPGNAYVVAAKRLLAGYVGIDLLPGPSEVLVLADESADARFVAADLLAQAEHGSGHERIWLVTTSGRLISAVKEAIERQLPALARRAFVERILEENTWLIQVKNMEQGVALTNGLAPEHCEVMTKNPGKIVAGLTTAGAIFIGPYSPTVLGDYVSGPSHVLPTGGAGRCFAGLTVDQFQRRTSVVEYQRQALKKSLPAVETLAGVEGLDAHARSAQIRFEQVKPSRAKPRRQGTAANRST